MTKGELRFMAIVAAFYELRIVDGDVNAVRTFPCGHLTRRVTMIIAHLANIADNLDISYFSITSLG